PRGRRLNQQGDRDPAGAWTANGAQLSQDHDEEIGGEQRGRPHATRDGLRDHPIEQTGCTHVGVIWRSPTPTHISFRGDSSRPWRRRLPKASTKWVPYSGGAFRRKIP